MSGDFEPSARILLNGDHFFLFTEKLSFRTAQKHCNANEGNLARMNTESEFLDLTRILEDQFFDVADRFWIGIESNVDGFEFTDGTTEFADFLTVGVPFWTQQDPATTQHRCLM